MFNSSVRTSTIPELWKFSNVSPLAKVVPPQTIEADIRPIFLLSVVGKLLESVMGTRILSEIASKIDVNQYGGQRGTSTIHALIDMLHTWHINAHNKKATPIIRK